MTRPISSLVRDYAEVHLRLLSLLTDAEAIQWSPAPVPKPRDDTTSRAIGGHGDPTLSIVLDERRLAVRADVDAAHRVLEQSLIKVRAATAHLQRSVDSWNGDTPGTTY